MELRKHAYALVLMVVLIGATVASLLSGISGPLPDVALGSNVLLHVERVLVILLAAYLVMVIVVRAWKAELAVKISKDGVEFPEAAIRDAESAAREAGGGADDSATDEPVEDLLTLRLELERKMSYIAKHLLSCGDRRDAFVTIGGLRDDGYITEDEARTASWILTLRDEELDTLPTGPRAAFLRNAEKVVASLRMSVFYSLVPKLLERNGWSVEQISTKRKRPDFHAIKGERQFRIVPRFAMKKASPILEKEMSRLEEFTGTKSKRGRVVIVVPDRSSSPLDADSDPAVVKLEGLKQMLSLDKDPRLLD